MFKLEQCAEKLPAANRNQAGPMATILTPFNWRRARDLPANLMAARIHSSSRARERRRAPSITPTHGQLSPSVAVGRLGADARAHASCRPLGPLGKLLRLSLRAARRADISIDQF